eukprot:Skav224057  [mRNA]  locus=scaffold534:463856:468311:- [translate_table: standard]
MEGTNLLLEQPLRKPKSEHLDRWLGRSIIQHASNKGAEWLAHQLDREITSLKANATEMAQEAEKKAGEAEEELTAGRFAAMGGAGDWRPDGGRLFCVSSVIKDCSPVNSKEELEMGAQKRLGWAGCSSRWSATDIPGEFVLEKIKEEAQKKMESGKEVRAGPVLIDLTVRAISCCFSWGNRAFLGTQETT